MRHGKPKITYDVSGTPGIWGEDAGAAYFGLGWVHARHRPLQTLLLHTAARGELSQRLWPRADLLHMDAMVHRLDLVRRGEAAAGTLAGAAAAWCDAYLAGLAEGLRVRGVPWELRMLLAKLPVPGRASTLSGLMLSAYLGLAEGQERMERLLVDCVAAGGAPDTLAAMFAPHLEGWDPAVLARQPREVPLGFAAHAALRVAGGSNAWAVDGSRTASGKPLLCGDPHLQVNQLPALFLEVRARVGDDYWLGASIPGLPGLAVGRNRRLAWSGTFAVADNVDSVIVPRPEAATQRHVPLGRRGRRWQALTFYDTADGVLERLAPDALAVRWAGSEAVAEALGAYLALPLCDGVAAASQVLARAHTLSLHFVLADRGGEIRYQQTGCIPRRSAGWSGLYPVPAVDSRRWLGLYTGAGLPVAGPEDGIVASANEARLAPDGGVLATLAQPGYRLERIRAELLRRRDHDVASMQALQQDVLSLQGLRLRPPLWDALPEGPVRVALAAWDGRCDATSVGAHAFAIAYRAALRGLAPRLGGAWWERALGGTEVSVWCCAALDRLLADASSWRGAAGTALRARVAAVATHPLRPWGEVQRFSLPHMLLGTLPRVSAGPLPLPGSVATVCQGNLVPAGDAAVAVGPAYRMVCDLADDALVTALPGGIDGHAWDPTYTRWLAPWAAGDYHRLAPPDGDES